MERANEMIKIVGGYYTEQIAVSVGFGNQVNFVRVLKSMRVLRPVNTRKNWL